MMKMKRTDKAVESQIIDDYRKGRSVNKILKKYSIENTTLYRILNSNSIKKRRAIGLRITKMCLHCKKEFQRIPYEAKIHKFCSKKCADDFKRGKSLVEFFGPEKAKNVTETARKRAKNNPNLRKFEKGFEPWNKGWDKGSYFSEEATDNIKKGQLKVAQMRKGKTLEEWFGKDGAIKWRKMQSNSKKYLWKTEEYRRKLVEAHLGQEAWNKGKKWKELFDEEKCNELTKKNREHILRLYSTGKFPKQTNTDIEINLKKELTKRGFVENVHFVHQFNLNDKFLCDFVFPTEKVIIECDGDWHHANPSKYDKEKLHPIQRKTINKDKSKDAYIRKIDNGSWTLLRFWGFEIKKDVSKCVDRIVEVLRKKYRQN